MKTTRYNVDIDEEDSILIIEDNKDIFFYLYTLLSKKNIQTIHAIDCESAMLLVEQYKDIIKLILLDINLSDGPGYRIVNDILKIKSIPIVVQTSYSFGSEREQSMNAGCSEFILKPISKDQLNKIIEKYYYK